jgi:hypothetical protein
MNWDGLVVGDRFAGALLFGSVEVYHGLVLPGVRIGARPPTAHEPGR